MEENKKHKSYTTYWIDDKGNERKTCLLATSEDSAMAQTECLYNDFYKGIRSELGTIPFSFS